MKLLLSLTVFSSLIFFIFKKIFKNKKRGSKGQGVKRKGKSREKWGGGMDRLREIVRSEA